MIGFEGANAGCVRRTKIKNLKAIHNVTVEEDVQMPVVFEGQR